MTTQYLIKNTTRKPRPKGQDIRRANEIKGYAVQFRDADDRIHLIGPNSNPKIMKDPLPEGLYGLAADGLISIEKTDGLASNLKEKFSQPKQEEPEEQKTGEGDVFAADAPSDGTTSLSEEEEKAKEEEKTEGKAVERKDPNAKAKASLLGNPVEKDAEKKSVNPDGENKHTVVAKSGDKRGNKPSRNR